MLGIVPDVIQREFGPPVEIERVEDDLAVKPADGGHQDAAVNGHWQHVAVVVIGVLTNEIHSPRRSHHRSRLVTENLLESLFYVN
jgi:hypothetical protein